MAHQRLPINWLIQMNKEYNNDALDQFFIVSSWFLILN